MKNSRNRTLRLYGPSLVMLCVLIPFFSYYLKQVKVQNGYQNDRAFRILDLIARQFNAEIDGAHNTMVASLIPLKETSPQEDDLSGIRAYLQAYVPDKYTIEDDHTSIPLDQPGNEEIHEVDVIPPTDHPHTHSIVQFQDSRNFIELSHEGKVNSNSRNVKIRIFLDPGKMLGRALENDRAGLFDTVFIASLDKTGEVLAQKDNPQVDVLLINTLLRAVRLHESIETGSGAKASDDSKSAESTGSLAQSASGANQRFEVQVSGATYLLFVVPAPFALDDHRQLSDKKANPNPPIPVAFYGLVRKDTLEKQALALPDLAIPAILVSLFACFAFLWPPLKLFTMSDRERLRKSSVATMAAMSLLAAVFIAALSLSWGLMCTLAENENDHLEKLAGMLRNRLTAELTDGFKTAAILDCLRTESHSNRTSFKDLETAKSPLAESLNRTYPFFQHLISSDRMSPQQPLENQKEIFKVSANAIPTPLIPLPAARFPFIKRLMLSPSKLDGREFVLQSFVSPNTGEFLPIIMFHPDLPAAAASIKDSRLMLLTTEFPSLVNIVLPRGFGFAVIEPNGTVDFHSDVSRNLRENFFSELEDSTDLRRSIRLREKNALTLHYGGQAVRALVQPLDDATVRLENTGLSLIVYSRFSEQSHRITVIGRDFITSMSGMLLLFAAFAAFYRLFRWTPLYSSTITYLKGRTWPRLDDKANYVNEMVWSSLCFLLAIAAAICLSPARNRVLLFLLLLVCIAGFVPFVQRHINLNALFRKELPRRWLESWPLSFVYSARIFAASLGLLGVLSVLVFQCCVSVNEKDQQQEDNAFFADKLKSRSERIVATLHHRNDGQDAQTLCSQKRKPFDIYQFGKNLDGHAAAIPNCSGPGESELSVSPLAPWPALPAVTWLTSLELYLPAFIVLVSLFIWLHVVIRRLFLLDFRAPEMLPQITKRELAEHINHAWVPAAARFARLLVFAHPQSGTSLAIADILAHLPKHLLKSPEHVLIDFSQLDANDEWNTSAFRQTVVDACENNRIVILDNFEVRLTEAAARAAKLALLEAVVYDHRSAVCILSSSDPLLLAQSLLNQDPENTTLQAEVARWTRVLSSFDRYTFLNDSPSSALDKVLLQLQQKVTARAASLSEKRRTELFDLLREELNSALFLRRGVKHIDFSTLEFRTPHDFEESLVNLIRQYADSYYSGLWLNCTSDERLALYQLAKDNWLNPLNKIAISHLWRKKLIVKSSPEAHKKDGPYRLMNLSFRAFVVETVSSYELATWKAQQNFSAWPALRMALASSIVVLAGFFFYVERDVFDIYFGYIAALAGGGTALIRIIFQFFARGNPTFADLVGGSAAKAGSQSA